MVDLKLPNETFSEQEADLMVNYGKRYLFQP